MAVKVVLLAATLLSGLSYFYARRGITREHYTHIYDSYHYFLAPRYYGQLDYTDLYACTVEALPPQLIPDDARVRDLRTYRRTTAGELRAERLCQPAETFTAAGWSRFTADLGVYVTTPGGLDILKLAITDRGYNGTPFHATVSGFLADKVPFSMATHNLLPLLDVAMICAMLYAAAAAFGWQVGLIFALSVFSMAADRWGIIGGSWFRYSWLATLVMGIAALRRGRYGWSGVWLGLSTLLNVFPAVFTFGVLLRGVVACWRERRIIQRYQRFVLAGALTGLIGFGIGLLPARHLDNYTGWLANMEQHNTERFQGYGMGLKFPFAYRGANRSEDDRVGESERRATFHDNRLAYDALAFTLLALAVGFAARTDDDVEAATILGFTVFFCFLGTVGYYFACASVVVLGLHRRVRTPGGLILLALWFLANGLGNWAFYETQYPRFMYNTVLSLSWTIWLAALLFWLNAREGNLAWFARCLAAPARTR